jgi:hypothetical protein
MTLLLCWLVENSSSENNVAGIFVAATVFDETTVFEKKSVVFRKINFYVNLIKAFFFL